MSDQNTPYHWYGVIHVVPGQTRSQLYEHLRGWVLGEVERLKGSALNRPTTIFFALEPDQL